MPCCEVNALERKFTKLLTKSLRPEKEFKQRIKEAATAERQAIEGARAELKEQQACALAELTSEQKEAISQTCRNLQDRVDALDKGLRQRENKVLDELLPEAFAAVRETARRKLGQRTLTCSSWAA
jgi:preprotein translocase subunit SecA